MTNLSHVTPLRHVEALAKTSRSLDSKDSLFRMREKDSSSKKSNCKTIL